jgi:hypothetical protein
VPPHEAQTRDHAAAHDALGAGLTLAAVDRRLIGGDRGEPAGRRLDDIGTFLVRQDLERGDLVVGAGFRVPQLLGI